MEPLLNRSPLQGLHHHRLGQRNLRHRLQRAGQPRRHGRRPPVHDGVGRGTQVGLLHPRPHPSRARRHIHVDRQLQHRKATNTVRTDQDGLTNLSRRALSRTKRGLNEFKLFHLGCLTLSMYFLFTWWLAPLAYLNWIPAAEFYPLFQVLNALSGIVLFMSLYITSWKFRAVLMRRDIDLEVSAKSFRETLIYALFSTLILVRAGRRPGL